MTRGECKGLLLVRNQFVKRLFDIIVAIVGSIFLAPVILVLWLVASVNTRSNGLFVQTRVGLEGVHFKVFKIKTMIDEYSGHSVSVKGDPRVTRIGSWFRRWKLDELPQIFNVLIGDMSFVGPRPDVPGFADVLTGDDRLLLLVRPGITGPASLKFSNEEHILAGVANPVEYNRLVIWPQKVEVNKRYVLEWSLSEDIRIIKDTLVGRD